MKTKVAGGIERLAEGIRLGECPRWHDGLLYFADWGAGAIRALGADGEVETIAEIRALPLSFDFAPDGAMWIVAGTRLLRRQGDGSLALLADLSSLSAKPWNEIVIDGRGHAYVNTIGFDFPGGAFEPGMVAEVTPDGRVRTVAGDVAFPNGMAVTADNCTLILAESYANRLTAFDIEPDGALTGRRVFAELPGFYPDGITLDAEGAVWYADVPNRCSVRVREGGEVMQRVAVDRGCFAAMLGGADGRTLHLMANEWNGPQDMGSAPAGQVLALRVEIPHAGWP